jgi:hypothetical protein
MVIMTMEAGPGKRDVVRAEDFAPPVGVSGVQIAYEIELLPCEHLARQQLDLISD